MDDIDSAHILSYTIVEMSMLHKYTKFHTQIPISISAFESRACLCYFICTSVVHSHQLLNELKSKCYELETNAIATNAADF